MENSLLERFNECKTLTEIYTVARTLKAEGVPDVEVNSLIQQAKKIVVSRSGSINRIQRIPISTAGIEGTPISQFPLSVEHINDPVIEIKVDGTIVI